MAFSQSTAYFYEKKSLDTADMGIYDMLAQDDAMMAAEDAEIRLSSLQDAGASDELIAAATTACAEVALAFEEAEQANQLAETALSTARSAGSAVQEAAALNAIAKVMIWWAPEDAKIRAKEAMDVAKDVNMYMRACALHTYAMALIACKQHSQAVVVGTELVNLFQESDDAVARGCASLCLAELHFQASNVEAAAKTARDAARIFESTGDRHLFKQALAMKAAAMAALSSSDTATDGFSYGDEALRLFEKAGTLKEQIGLKLEMANVKLRAETFVEAEDLAEAAQETAKKLGDIAQEAEAAQVLATIRLALAVEDAKERDEPEADTVSATEASRDALVLFRKCGNRKGEARAMHKLAQVRFHAGASDLAKTAAEEAQSMFRELGDVSGEAGAVLLIAHVLHKDEQFDSAKRIATKAYTLYQSLADEEGMGSCTSFLDEVKNRQAEKTRETKANKPSVSETGLVKLVNSTKEAEHLLSYLADTNDEDDTELSEFDLSQWGTSMNSLQIKA